MSGEWSADQALWALYNRRAARLTPTMAATLREAYARLEAALDTEQLASMIANGEIDRLISDELLSHATSEVEAMLIDIVRKASEATIPELPAMAREAAFGSVQFNVLNPVVVEAIRELETTVLVRFAADVRDTIRAFVENGIRDGVNPRTIARELRSIVGLAPNQLAAIDHYREALEAAQQGEGAAAALQYQLRDKRFDRTVKAGTLTDAQIAKMTEAYRKAMLAFHAETIARTSTLDAYRLGQQLTWQRAIANGTVDGSRLTKTWVAVMDDRTRPEHRALNRTTVLFSEPYPNGEQIPGESTFNCRCVSRMRVLAADELLPIVPDVRPTVPDAAIAAA